MKRTSLNTNWMRIDSRQRFGPGAQNAVSVNLPDDFLINKERFANAADGPASGFFPCGEATYIKELPYESEWENKTILLNIDGAGFNTEVSLNDDLLAIHPYGYAPVMVDLTSYINQNKNNTLSIFTQVEEKSSRWYTGGGLFREVSLLVGGPCYLHPWEIFLQTTEVSESSAVIHFEIDITSNLDYAKEIELSISIGNEKETLSKTAVANGKTRASGDITIDHPELWSADEPNLYRVAITLKDAKETLDTHEMSFGIRVTTFDSIHGMRVNGNTVKLRGGSCHHDNALIGARSILGAEERKLRKLKEAGFNAVRTAHNPPSELFLELCDKIGLYVLDEFFDVWHRQKNANDYHKYFDEWWQRDIEASVRRDRNHPCVYAWSIGNEINELNGNTDGEYWTETQRNFVLSLDSSRPVSASLNHLCFPKGVNRGMMMHNMDMLENFKNPKSPDGTFNGIDYWNEATQDCLNKLDIVGYNYMWPRFRRDHELYPKRVIHSTESHTWHTYDNWQAVLENNHVIGDFVWTAADFLGEGGAGRLLWSLKETETGLMGPWPYISSGQGDFDLDMNRKPQSFYRSIVWGMDDGLYIFTTSPNKTGKKFYGSGWHWPDVHPTWTFSDADVGRDVRIDVYCNCDEVEFYLNGNKVAKAVPEKYLAHVILPYEKGSLEAIGYKKGKEIARSSLHTTGYPVAIRLSPEKTILRSDGLDLAYISIEAVDEDGNLTYGCSQLINVSVDGAGELLGLGSGSICTDESYADYRKLYHGKALLCIRAGLKPGRITVSVEAGSLKGSIIELKVL